MGNNVERGEARVLLDKIKVNNREIEMAVVAGLTQAGFDVEIEPDIMPGSRLAPNQEPGGSTIKAFMKVGGGYE